MANKTLLLLVAFMCIMHQASASIMLEKWFELMVNANFENFLRLVVWQLFSTIGPIAAGLVYPAVYNYWTTLDDKVRYGAS